MTGSRDWADRDAIWNALNHHASSVGTTVVHGDCPRGADALAQAWTECQPDVVVERHPADWNAYGKSAGFRRNAEMVALGADVCLAFIKNGSRGASHTAGLAEKAGIRTLRFIA